MIISENRYPPSLSPGHAFRDHALVARLRIYEFRVLVNPLTIGHSRHQMGFVERAGVWAVLPGGGRRASGASQACKANLPSDRHAGATRKRNINAAGAVP